MDQGDDAIEKKTRSVKKHQRDYLHQMGVDVPKIDHFKRPETVSFSLFLEAFKNSF